MISRRIFLRLVSAASLIFPYGVKSARAQTAEHEALTLSLDRLQSPWDNITFNFGPGAVPGLAVRLPGGSITVVNRTCPHQKCFIDFIKDPTQVLRETTFEPPGPVLVCPCHASIFDLSDGGKVLFGPAPRPPDRFKFRIEGEKIVVTGLEA
jgi:Rieske Fe-S protein